MTAEGRKTLTRLRRLSQQLEDEFFASLDQRDREQLHALLRRVAEEQLPTCGQSIPIRT
jgi:DNA-binding MarR family transcriptional regulator